MSLMLAMMLSSLEANITSTSLPVVVEELGSTAQFVWIQNSFVLTSTVIQPLCGQLAEIFGRKSMIIGSVAAFTIGSTICGLAPGIEVMISGRAIQGTGVGGIFVLVDLIISDIVPLRERPWLLGLLMIASAVAFAVGPSLGGALTEFLNWRWIYLINVPLGLVCILALIIFLKLKRPLKSWKVGIREIDFVGTITLSVSSVAIMLALAETEGFWNSPVLSISFFCGCAGLVLFMILQNSWLCPYPAMPVRLFNSGSSLAFCLTLLSNGILMMVPFYWGIYFQAVLQATPFKAGIYLLGTVIVLVPAAMVVGALVTQTGRYKIAHIASFVLTTISMGGGMLLTERSGPTEWLSLEAIGAVGIAALLPTALPAAQAPLPDSDAAMVTAAFSFFRSFGLLWGFSIPTFVFNLKIERVVGNIDDENVRELLRHGGAFANARASFIAELGNPIKQEVITVFKQGLQAVWKCAFASSLLGLVIASLEKEYKLRTTLDSQFGLDESPFHEISQTIDDELGLEDLVAENIQEVRNTEVSR